MFIFRLLPLLRLLPLQTYLQILVYLKIFDGILCGFLPELEQFSALHSYFSNQKQQGCNILLDPVMGDNGTLYSITTPEICEGYRALLPITDFIVPNLTECCALLEIPYPSIPPTVEKLFSYAENR